ncbi:hypothetical protein LZG04_15485 [Saccharothrix sp. S26]|uniref:hypothetical protein n=1 Tax=Saccharothrix sp. S26 TaxID=2907215 RepID=UPI001F24C2FD|nr:hypothetical protein [Saccharothrix sp. S26]MCE6996193.1 hypothetical protein [Saccharothrix sp. S26]
MSGSVEELELSEALGRLAAYNMIDLTADTVTVHNLVRAVTCISDPNDPHRQPIDITTDRDTDGTAHIERLLNDLGGYLDGPGSRPRRTP